MRSFIFLLMSAFLLTGSALAGPRSAERPNIILISVDAMRPDHMSAFGYGRRTTPHLDGIAACGVSFVEMQTSIPLTNPAMVSCFSSRYPYETGAIRNGLRVRPEVLLLPQILKQAGYTTAGVAASWPLGRPRSGLAEHFDFYEDQLRDQSSPGYPLEREARWTTEHGRKILRAGLQPPFFFWAHYADPHQPHDLMPGFTFPTPSDSPSSKVIDGYDSELAYADYWIGVLLDEFETLGLLENTLIIIMADHGENLGEKTFVGHGRWLYQNILRIPFIMSGPGLPAGLVIRDPVQIIDIAPTILAYLGLPPGGGMEGRSLLPRILEKQLLPPLPMFAETYGVAVFNIFPGIRKIAAYSRPSAVALRQGGLKVIYTFKSRRWAMFDLEDDPQENHDLAPGHPAFRSLAEELAAWYARRNPSVGLKLPE